MGSQQIEKYHLGCTGWSLKEWKGNFFTEDAQPNEFLHQYATVFNSVEGNTSFYNIPDKKTLVRWGHSVGDGFKFCFKFHQSITHKKMLEGVKDDILNFLERFEVISNNLGPFMLQLPPGFSFERIQYLEQVCSFLPAHYSYAVEVRHPDFFDQGNNENHFNQLLKSYNIDRVIFDTRKLHALQPNDKSIKKAQQKKPNVPVRFTTTGTRPLVRYVGSNDVLNNEVYLKEWAIMLADWIREGKKPYIFTHAPSPLKQPPIARKFHNLLSGFLDTGHFPSYPSERSANQQELF